MMHHSDVDALLPPLEGHQWAWPLTGPELERYLATCETGELRELVRELTGDLAAALARFVPPEQITTPSYGDLIAELGESS